jgi:hypothetical protein
MAMSTGSGSSRDMIARSTESPPTEPGVHRMPCGKCYVDFFLASDDTDKWLVPGDERSWGLGSNGTGLNAKTQEMLFR